MQDRHNIIFIFYCYTKRYVLSIAFCCPCLACDNGPLSDPEWPPAKFPDPARDPELETRVEGEINHTESRSRLLLCFRTGQNLLSQRCRWDSLAGVILGWNTSSATSNCCVTLGPCLALSVPKNS